MRELALMLPSLAQAAVAVGLELATRHPSSAAGTLGLLVTLWIAWIAFSKRAVRAAK